MEGFYGEVRLFAGNFAPKNWAICDGTVLQVTANTALFALLGNFFGGDGRQTFALPDLRGRVVVGVGQGNGLSSYALGKPTGAGRVPTQIVPAHAGSEPRETVNSVRSASGDNVQPVLGLNYIICVRGTFPDRPR
jgi:microcystin-dependent protein